MIEKIKRSYKYRIYPTKAQTDRLRNQFSMCRHLYNWCLKERIDFYRYRKASLLYEHQALWLSMLKKERPWYKSIYSQVLQDVLKRLDKAFKNFYLRFRKGEEKKGFPKFKKKGKWTSITYPLYKKKPANNKIKVPKIGNLKVRLHRLLPEDVEIKTLIISQEGGKWFACFSFEQELDIELKQDLPPVGIDLGLIDFVYDSNGWNKPNEKHLKKHELKLKLAQKHLSKTKKRTSKYLKCLKIVQRLYCNVKNSRSDFLHKTANEILNKSDTIFYENLNIKRMLKSKNVMKAKQKGLNKSITDAGWGKFLNILQYKARTLGKKVLGVPAQYTSQKCSACSIIVKKSLSIRTHKCKCGFVVNRDYNAARNILSIGLNTLGLESLDAR